MEFVILHVFGWFWAVFGNFEQFLNVDTYFWGILWEFGICFVNFVYLHKVTLISITCLTTELIQIEPSKINLHFQLTFKDHQKSNNCFDDQMMRSHGDSSIVHSCIYYSWFFLPFWKSNFFCTAISIY